MIGLSERKFRTQLRGTSDLDVMYGCIGEKLKVRSTVYFEEAIIISEESDGWSNPPANISNNVYNDNCWWVADGAFFNHCQVGDIVAYRPFSYPTFPEVTATIVEILNGGLARMNATYGSVRFVGGVVYNKTAMKSVIYKYGLGIGGYNSKVDNSEQKFTLNTATQTSLISTTSANAIGNKDWQFNLNELTITGNGESPSFAGQSIIIEHNLLILPLFSADQLDDLSIGLAPTNFKADNKIRYSSIVDFNKSSVLVNAANNVQFEDVGQFGWYNTRYDGASSQYSLTSLQFKRTDLSVANQLEYVPIEVKFILNSSLSNFDSTNTALVFGFNYLPTDESFYKNINRTIEDNFCFDSIKLNPNNVVVTGEKFGTSKQIIKNIKAEVLTSSTCEITVNVDIASGQLPILKQSDIANYAIWCIVERTDSTPELSDKSNVLIDVNYLYVQKTKIDLLDMATIFIEHPYNDMINGNETLEMFPVDDVVASSIIQLDYTGLENDGIVIKSVVPSIVLTHSTEADIILDKAFISTENYPTVGSLPSVQDINYTFNRPYKIESGIRKTLTLQRDYLSDTGNTYAWLLSFPFMNRWEYWVQILGLGQIPTTLFDNTRPFGGANQLWNRLANSSGWSLKYRTTFGIVQNGENFEQTFDSELTSTNFNSNTDWSNCDIKTYDIATNTNIVVGAKEFMYGSKDTLVKCTFQKTSGDVPDVTDVAIVIWLESYEGGGITDIRRISSVYNVIPTAPFKGVEGLNKVKISKSVNTFTGEALIDFSKLPSSKKVTMYARIYEVVAGEIPEGGRITQNEELRITNDGYVRIVN